MNRGRN